MNPLFEIRKPLPYEGRLMRTRIISQAHDVPGDQQHVREDTDDDGQASYIMPRLAVEFFVVSLREEEKDYRTIRRVM